MARKRKTMVSFRLSADLLRRVDFIVGNTPNDALASRSAVVVAAIEAWLPGVEGAVKAHLRDLGADFTARK